MCSFRSWANWPRDSNHSNRLRRVTSHVVFEQHLSGTLGLCGTVGLAAAQKKTELLAHQLQIAVFVHRGWVFLASNAMRYAESFRCGLCQDNVSETKQSVQL
jgi:hypothetical protein